MFSSYVNGKIYGCICGHYKKCLLNCRLPDQDELIIPANFERTIITEQNQWYNKQIMRYDIKNWLGRWENIIAVETIVVGHSTVEYIIYHSKE
jgi:hypothetical protein